MAAHARLAFTGPCKGIYFIGRNTVASVESASLPQFTAADVTTAGNVAEVYVIGDNGRLGACALGELRFRGNSAVIKAKSHPHGPPAANRRAPYPIAATINRMNPSTAIAACRYITGLGSSSRFSW